LDKTADFLRQVNNVVYKTKKLNLEKSKSKHRMVVCGSCTARTLPNKFVCCDCIIFESHSRQRVIKESTVMIDRFSKEISDILQLREPPTCLLGLNKKKSHVKALRDLISHELRDIAELTTLVKRFKESNRYRNENIVKHQILREKCEKNLGILIRSHEKQRSLLVNQRAALRKWSHDLTEAYLKLLPLVKPVGKAYHKISFFRIPDPLLPFEPRSMRVKKDICAGLGAVVLFTQVLAKYHNFTLPHRTKFQGSSSKIFDANDKAYPISLPDANLTEDESHNVELAFELLDHNVIALCEHASSNTLPRRLFRRESNQFLSNLLLLINDNREEQRYRECTSPSLLYPLAKGFLPNLPMVRRVGSSGSRPSFEHHMEKKT
jgi:hypothetical protein